MTISRGRPGGQALPGPPFRLSKNKDIDDLVCVEIDDAYCIFHHDLLVVPPFWHDHHDVVGDGTRCLIEEPTEAVQVIELTYNRPASRAGMTGVLPRRAGRPLRTSAKGNSVCRCPHRPDSTAMASDLARQANPARVDCADTVARERRPATARSASQQPVEETHGQRHTTSQPPTDLK
jgi:hypothetical protein